MENQENIIYYSYQKIDSYGCHIEVVIGARGIGKTFGAKKKCCKRFKYNSGHFAWIRDTESACDKIRANNGADFFKDLAHRWNPKFFDLSKCYIKQDVIYINGEYAGKLLALSTYYNNKGAVFDDIDTVVLDEFIPEKIQANRGSRARQFLNTIESIGRLRPDFKIILLANSLDLADDILDIFDIKITDFGYYVNRDKDVVIHYAPNNPEFDSKRKKSLSGKLISGTQFEEQIAQNKFDCNDLQFFDKRPPKCQFMCILHNDYGCCRLYERKGTIYVDHDLDPNWRKELRFVNNIRDVSPYRKLMGKNQLDNFRAYFKHGRVEFKNATLRKVFIEFIK